MSAYTISGLRSVSDEKEVPTTTNKMNSWMHKTCSRKTLKNRLPVMKWLPSYTGSMLICDVLGGLIVGATFVAQGIAYADIAGLPTEYGLYSGIVGGFIYFVFGICRNMSIGPTAILSALVVKHVGLSPDFAVLMAFLSGVLQITLAVFQLGSLVNFFSSPVITGFATAAAIQIASTQIKSFLGLKGSSGSTFIEAIYVSAKNIATINIWDTMLSIVTVILIIFLKKFGQGCSQHDGVIKKTRRFLSLSRNVFVIILGLLVSYILYVTSNQNVISIVGDINGGLPEVKLPPFNSVVGNQTYYFRDMLNELGPKFFVVPFMAIMEVVIISRAFTPDEHMDATQEIIALGLCNLIGSFFGSYPVTGAFSRSALNEASGVKTPASGVIVSCLVILALSWGTAIFYFIPKSSLAAMIIVAVYALIDTDEIIYLWKNSKREFFVLLVTILAGLTLGLEYGVILGVFIDLLFIIYRSARPTINVNVVNINGNEIAIVTMPERTVYCSGEFVRKTITRKVFSNKSPLVIIDGRNLQEMDSTVVSNVMALLDNLDSNQKVIFLNFSPRIIKMCTELAPKHGNKFKSAISVEKLMQDISIDSV